MTAPATRAALTPLVVVGDALLDIDLDGRVDRVMPDAPAPVVAGIESRPRPGGAALAAALAAAEGREVVLVTAVAEDEPGRLLTRLIGEAGVELNALPYAGGTPVKRRVRSAGQSLLRLDEGGEGAVGEPPEKALEAILCARALLVSDYGRGVTAQPAVRRALAATDAPIVWDPHPRGTAPVPGVRLATPNRDEAERLAPADSTGSARLTGIGNHAAALVEAWKARAVAVTLGSAGALLSRGEDTMAVFPAPRVAVGDSCGAGDAFAAAAAAAIADGAVTSEAVERAVATAAAFVAAGGAATYPHQAPTSMTGPMTGPMTGSAGAGESAVARVRRRHGVVVATGGCFDLLHAGHVATLEAARALGDCLVVCLNSDDSVRRLKGAGRPVVPQADRARLLAALACVDEVVVFDEDTPETVLRRLQPDVWVKGGDYAVELLPEAPILREWGGQAVVLPYLEGRSTTSLVASAARG